MTSILNSVEQSALIYGFDNRTTSLHGDLDSLDKQKKSGHLCLLGKSKSLTISR